MHRRPPRALKLAAILALSFGAPAALLAADAFPTRPITLVVPYAPGGAGDILGRSVAKELASIAGKPVVVENKPGAGGNIGAELVARAQDKEGYTLLLGATSLASNPSLMRNMPVDPLKDLVAVSGVASLQNVIAVNPSSKLRSVADLIAEAKAHPGKLTFGTAGIGTSSHLSVELFKGEVGVDLLHVPYKSGGPAMADVMAGNLDLVFELMPAVVGHVRSGKLRGIAVTGTARSEALPDLPTVAESGYPKYSFVSWFGIFGPAGMEAKRVAQLNEMIGKALTSDEFKARLEQLGAEGMPGSSAQFDQFFQGEVSKWKRVVAEQSLPLMN
ncbi:MAG: tripartite tricarboxylate transporter substrate binding protein [Pigmentiphaga sp.]|uniref:tripartite tricarboxylate transporter substrate binding protein n=1 Tax=Pigmentiphaga sp. TaxID=1977564 RepID=UPI0029BAB0F7|nr:tripartite tricarboxylate transporter substrate binding protein [Pigmentiphaga sp.]MDX3906414.1 tripartite tricarboxylate transporter substrate binding protein [Pigmentiphaga sp.]